MAKFRDACNRVPPHVIAESARSNGRGESQRQAIIDAVRRDAAAAEEFERLARAEKAVRDNQ